eukprot:scaffold101578_cov39-Prasinocladus_malaysianus.AAC.1
MVCRNKAFGTVRTIGHAPSRTSSTGVAWPTSTCDLLQCPYPGRRRSLWRRRHDSLAIWMPHEGQQSVVSSISVASRHIRSCHLQQGEAFAAASQQFPWPLSCAMLRA